MAVSSCAKVLPRFECRSDPEYPKNFRLEYQTSGKQKPPPICKSLIASFGSSPGALLSLIYQFPSNFQRQFSTKVRRNCIESQ
ncbi:cystathionine gamma-synthase [Sarracenia purpurea var. burkii]